MGTGTAHGTWFTDDDVVIWTAFKGTHRKARGKSLEKFRTVVEEKFKTKSNKYYKF